MAMKVVQTSTVTAETTTSTQLSSISLMLEYEIDNTLNAIKENKHKKILKKMIRQESLTDDSMTDASVSSSKSDKKLCEINNNNNNNNNSNKQLLKASSLEIHHNEPTKTNARKRWKILAKVLRKDSSEESSVHDDDDEETTVASVRRFKSFDLLRQDSLNDTSEISILSKPENWYTYRLHLTNVIETETIEFSVNIHHIERHLTASDLMGFNNTGNICVWPSEEALTVYVLSNLTNFHNKWILELGGGMTCLAGLMLAKYSKAYLVHLTDGNEISIDNVRRTLCLNKLSSYTKCSVLKWEDHTQRIITDFEKFDWILSADCLFFDEARLPLIDTIWYYLSQNGKALIIAPRRGKTLQLFVNECEKKGFEYQILYRYNEIIWNRHLELLKQKSTSLYDEDIHYPILIILNKMKKSCNGAIITQLTTK